MQLYRFIDEGSRPLDRELPELTQDALNYLNNGERCPIPEQDRQKHRRALSTSKSADERRDALEAFKEALKKVLT